MFFPLKVKICPYHYQLLLPEARFPLNLFLSDQGNTRAERPLF